jgi:1,4-dihydroxy-2-naphthoyl-CoA hydrolase
MSASKVALIEAYCEFSDSLPSLLGITLETVGDQTLTAFLEVTADTLNPAHTGCHAATLVALADTACGWGCVAHLPSGASSFTTIDLSCNLLRSVTSGRITCTANMLHGGRTTQVWDAVIADEAQRNVAAFRCTELVLHA